ncbi:MAG: hypothetical protein C0487_04720 [Leptothrix sp. (in: Bacteria)]|nr:hypothetical protein [Leptothrix sp. (in: b-proteobacteria)]
MRHAVWGSAHLDDDLAFGTTRFDVSHGLIGLAGLGRQYLSYARDHALEYRLMFDTPWPQSAEHPDLIRDAVHTYDILRNVLRRLHGESAAMQDRVDLDALYIWSTVHGMAGVMNGNCIHRLNLKPQVLEQAIEHMIKMEELGLLAKH